MATRAAGSPTTASFYKTRGVRPKRIDAYVIRWARRVKRMRHQTKGARDWFDRHRAIPGFRPLASMSATAEHREPCESRGRARFWERGVKLVGRRITGPKSDVSTEVFKVVDARRDPI
jgi:hypothetical protein